jgi:rhodanese-related sulfurtransferase
MAATTMKTISTSELERRLRDDVGLHLWNVLNDEWFKGELIPGSRRVPLAGLGDSVRRSTLLAGASVVVYCAGPTCPASREAAGRLAELGYTNVEAFEGGLEEWKRAGHGVVTAGSER